MTQQERLAQFAALAVDCERRYGIPAEATCAQWAVESGWGTRASGKNNLFGIKRAARHKQGEWVKTKEVYASQAALNQAIRKGSIRNADITEYGPGSRVKVNCEAEFASFNTPEEAMDDRAVLLTTAKVYAPYWQQFQVSKDMEQWLRGIATKYATAPAYGDLLVQIARQDNVTGACRRARSEQTVIS